MKHLLIAYFLSNTSVEKYQNPFVCQKFAVSFFETQCTDVGTSSPFELSRGWRYLILQDMLLCVIVKLFCMQTLKTVYKNLQLSRGNENHLHK